MEFGGLGRVEGMAVVVAADRVGGRAAVAVAVVGPEGLRAGHRRRHRMVLGHCEEGSRVMMAVVDILHLDMG